MKQLNTLIIFFLFSLSHSFSQSENNLCKNFKALSRPEKYWVLWHPFVAKKAWKTTVHVREISLIIKKDSTLDGDILGGQADAFRHAFWMASLVRKIYWRKAYKLGKAHEKGNKIDFRKKRYEDGFLPDSVSIEMDLFNNKVGILIGKQYKGLSEEKLVSIIKAAILKGEMKIIKKDIHGNSLDEKDEIIFDWIGKWSNLRVLVSSDYSQNCS